MTGIPVAADPALQPAVAALPTTLVPSSAAEAAIQALDGGRAWLPDARGALDAGARVLVIDRPEQQARADPREWEALATAAESAGCSLLVVGRWASDPLLAEARSARSAMPHAVLADAQGRAPQEPEATLAELLAAFDGLGVDVVLDRVDAADGALVATGSLAIEGADSVPLVISTYRAAGVGTARLRLLGDRSRLAVHLDDNGGRAGVLEVDGPDGMSSPAGLWEDPRRAVLRRAAALCALPGPAEVTELMAAARRVRAVRTALENR